MDGGGFSGHYFDHHGDCHSGGEAVRVENDVGDETGFREREVFGGPFLGADAFLTGAAGEFVTD